MKILYSALLLLTATASAQISDQPDYDYLSQNGLGSYNSNSPGTSNIDGGSYSSFTLTLQAGSFNKTQPEGGRGSLTTASNADGTAMTSEQQEEAQLYFSAGSVVQLTKIAVLGRNNDGSSFGDNIYLTIKDDQNNILGMSSIVAETQQRWEDPWLSGSSAAFYSSQDVGTFSFSSSILLEVGETYNIAFTNADGDTSRSNLVVTQNGDMGFAGGNTWSPVVKVSTSSYIPEPSTATLSLLALSGLLARRRRKTA